MTTRRAAESLLFEKPEDVSNFTNVSLPENVKTSTMGQKRRRVRTYRCDRCAGWADVLLQPVRLRCARCGHEVGHG
jgi:rRNA maturation endonuclease Nob1